MLECILYPEEYSLSLDFSRWEVSLKSMSPGFSTNIDNKLNLIVESLILLRFSFCYDFINYINSPVSWLATSYYLALCHLFLVGLPATVKK